MTEPSVFETALAYQETAALTAAVKLDVFSLIGAGSTTVDALVSATGASPRGLRILCDYLTVIGLLQKQGTNYDLTPVARRFLDRSSPLAMGDCVDFLAAPEMLALVLDDPVSYVRRGGAEGLSVIAPDHPVWVRFARAMAPFAALTAKRVAAYVATLPQSPLTVLDVAAGHGLYGIEVARAVPAALVTAVDWAGSSRLRGRMRRPPGWMIGSARSSAVHSTWSGGRVRSRSAGEHSPLFRSRHMRRPATPRKIQPLAHRADIGRRVCPEFGSRIAAVAGGICLLHARDLPERRCIYARRPRRNRPCRGFSWCNRSSPPADDADACDLRDMTAAVST
jgi:hypothetical protein